MLLEKVTRELHSLYLAQPTIEHWTEGSNQIWTRIKRGRHSSCSPDGWGPPEGLVALQPHDGARHGGAATTAVLQEQLRNTLGTINQSINQCNKNHHSNINAITFVCNYLILWLLQYMYSLFTNNVLSADFQPASTVVQHRVGSLYINYNQI